MNCIEFLPFGSYLRPIQKMAKGGTTSVSAISEIPDSELDQKFREIHREMLSVSALADKSDSELEQMYADLRREMDEHLFLPPSLFQRIKKVKAEIARRESGKMAKGGTTASRGDGTPTKDGTLRGLEQFLGKTKENIVMQRELLTRRQGILPKYAEIDKAIAQALLKLNEAQHIVLDELGPDYFSYKLAVMNFQRQGMSTRDAKREAKKKTGYSLT